MNVQIQPLQEQIDVWIEKHVPEKDLFFLKEQDLTLFKSYLQGALVMPRDELRYSSYNQIQWVNSYTTWNISKDFQFVIVAQPDWIMTLELPDRELLFRMQYEAGRGLIFPLTYFSETAKLPKEYIINADDEQVIIIQKNMWMKLPISYQEEAIKAYAQQYDDWTSTEIPANIPAHLRKYANTFSTTAGANCLAAVLYAVSTNPERQEWIINEWIFQNTFTEGVKNAGYSLTDKEFQKGDVVVWENEEGVTQHASYCIGNQLFFNKNGQTFFNPWKIVTWDELQEEWKRFTPCVYRKSRSDLNG
ncbi:hypothetical protein [Sporosarcina sp. FSL K6-3457]|uniref:hypothetical protein n=1 Tax=Sporosarcina sp. FSL K6-3457 TaxID=2978204 RepID=UPI0030FCDD8C